MGGTETTESDDDEDAEIDLSQERGTTTKEAVRISDLRKVYGALTKTIKPFCSCNLRMSRRLPRKLKPHMVYSAIT